MAKHVGVAIFMMADHINGAAALHCAFLTSVEVTFDKATLWTDDDVLLIPRINVSVSPVTVSPTRPLLAADRAVCQCSLIICLSR